MNYKEAKSKNPKIKRINYVTGETMVYDNLDDVVKDNFSRDSVLRCIRGRNHSHKGYIWKLEI